MASPMPDIRRQKQALKKQPESYTPSSAHPFAWVRAFIGPGFILTGWQIMSLSYVAGLTIILFGFMGCLAECIWEPELIKRPYQIQIVLIGIMGFLFDMFAINVAFVAAPINFTSFQTDIDYTAGNAPAGISWEPFFTELDFIVTNPSDGNYDNVDLLVRPDFPVAKVAQQSSLQGVSFEDRYGVNVRATVEEVGFRPPIPMVFLGTNAGYKVHCASIPPNTSLSLVLAVVEFTKAKPEDSGRAFTIPSGADLSRLVMSPTITNKEGTFTYWFGSAVNKVNYIPKPTVKDVHVEISYTTRYRKRNKTAEVSVDPWKRQ
jgi:hypothetical protein